MSDGNVTVFGGVVIRGDDAPGLLFVDSTALINFDRIGGTAGLDTLLAANRTVVITPEVRKEAVEDGFAAGKTASAQRILSWIELHSALGDVQSESINSGRPQFTTADGSGKGPGEQSILADAAFSRANGTNNGSPIIVSDDGHVSLQYFVNASDAPVLTGNYFLSSLLLGGGITPNDYFQKTEAGKIGGFSQDKFFAEDESSLIKNGVEYPLVTANGIGTYRYTTVGMSEIFLNGKVIQFAPDEKGGVQDGVPIKVTDASDGGHLDTYFDTANLQPWFTNAFAYDPQDRLSGKDTVNDDGTSTKTVFDTGTQPWSSQISAFDAYQRLQSQRVVFDGGSQQVKEYDPNNTHPYKELDVAKGADGKVTTAQVTLDPNVIAAGFSVGQIFGSALGGALGGNDLVGRLVGSAVGGLIGQKFVQVLATSMTADLSQVSLADVFSSQGINIAGAGIGAVSSFLTAELGTALHIGGFGGTLFNIAGSSLTFSVLSQVVNSNLAFDAAIAAIDWSQAVSGAFNAAQLNLDGVLGGYLAHEFVPAKTHEGAVGGELLGAIGNLILPGGLGSFLGTLLGTLIFNHFGTSPSPGAVDLLDQAGYYYNSHQYQASDHGTYDFPDKMAPAADAIINAYLRAVNGVALDHSKQAILGYIVNPDLLFLSGTPGHPDHSFTNADDAVHAAALDVLQNLEVIGGDLLLKRAHHNSPSNDPAKAPANGGLPGQAQFSAAEQLVTMSGDLSVAQDYETYLNNREAINALIAANPDSAFAAGWIATFARVNDLGLNHTGPSDFLGGLVGYLDSVNKAGLGAVAANATVSHSGSSLTVAIKVPNGSDIPGALSVFADQTNVTSDASGQTVQLVFNNGLGTNTGLGAVGFHTLAAGATQGDNFNDLWFANTGTTNGFLGTSGNDILVGGPFNDAMAGGPGWDYMDGGAGNDLLLGGDGNDILRGGPGGDYVQGGSGDDTYILNRGDGSDTFWDDYWPLVFVPDLSGPPGSGTYQNVHTNGGSDTLVFGPEVSLADIAIQVTGADLLLKLRDPAHPGVPFGQLADNVRLQSWTDPLDRIETFKFADGTTLNLAAGTSALAAYDVPFGAKFDGGTVVENSANGTVVGTVAGYDFDSNAALNYSLLDNAGGLFAIDPSTGVVFVANGPLLDFARAASHQITVRTADQSGHVFDKAFTIGVTEDPGITHTPLGSVVHNLQSIGGQIDALYDGILNRTADVLGLEGWVAAAEHGVSLHDVAAGFLGSGEAQQRYGATSNAQFVEQLYESALHRSADGAGLQNWTTLMDNGMSRADVAIGISFSQENIQGMQASLNAGVFVPDPDASDVARLYYGILGRGPDPVGLSGWADQVERGASLSSVAQGFFGSQEYLNAHAGLNDAQFIDSLYVNALGHHADAAGVQAWSAPLAAGVTRADVAVGTSESSEAHYHLLAQIEGSWHLA